MAQNRLDWFESIARRAYQYTEALPASESSQHPFDARNICSDLPTKVQQLFDDGHFAEATFAAAKFLDKEVQRHSGAPESGYKLVMQVLGGTEPTIRLTPMVTTSEIDEQKGFQFLFAGSVLALRNPRGHEHTIQDDPDSCLDHLSFISMLLRRLADAGYT